MMKTKVIVLLWMICCTMTACAKTKGRDFIAVDSLAGVEDETTEYQLIDEIQEYDSGDDFYSICTSFSKKEVEDFAEQVKAAIIEKDYTNLSNLIIYPITIGEKEYKDADSFLSEVPEFNEDFIDRISQLETQNLFCNWQGIMLGEGEVWISEVLNDNLDSEGLKVIGINIK